MSPDIKKLYMPAIQVAMKELKLFFASPIAYLFLGVFVACTYFIVFWGEAYFARNIADVRPMFEWMPILLIFLSAALSMRMWSEERRSGTLEHVLTLPVSSWQFVLGKFSACKTLLVIALLLTLPLPIIISFTANIDWGPVISGYLATIFMGSAYLAIGLYVSSRSENQIVSLILTVVLCGIFYLLGSSVFTNLVNNDTANILRAIGSGSRFESITRGVLDFRDFYFYLSVASVFLVLNRYALEKDRWANDGNIQYHRRWNIETALIVINLVAFNFVLSPLSALRVDTTEGKIYSISDATRGYLNQLQEPLLIRGYFSAKTHPYLAPLVPELEDLLKEYAQENRSKVRVEIVDPANNPEAEEEAGTKFGIKPVPFRVDDRYQSAVVNSYFNIVIQYGDENKVLGFQDLIEVKSQAEGGMDIKLRNPEYDITNAIKQVLYAYQAGGNLFDSIEGKLNFTAYVSPDEKLPTALKELNGQLKAALAETVEKSHGKFTYEFIDPEANGGAVAAKIDETYGFKPMASSLFDLNTFYYYLVINNQQFSIQVALPEELTKKSISRAIDSSLKRFAKGFTKTVGVVAPKSNPYAAQMGQVTPASFNALQQLLNENLTAKETDISTGKVGDDIDLLMVLAPEELSNKAVFAIDQFLMRGGTVIMATSPYKAQFEQDSMSATTVISNLQKWLLHNGIDIKNSLVMDSQNSAFPLPVMRDLGGFAVQDVELLNYPYFIEIRDDGLNNSNPVTANLQQLSIPWASPLLVDQAKNANREITVLAKSSANSWLSSDLDINPRITKAGEPEFEVGKIEGSQNLAVALSGSFDSFFVDKPSPLLPTAAEESEEKTEKSATADTKEKSPTNEVISSVIEHSPESSRLIVIASNSFAEDKVLGIQSSIAGNNYINPQQFVINAAEWSLEDEGLMSIRSRGHFNRTLAPTDDKEKQFWEIVIYALSVAGLLIIFLIVFLYRRMNEIKHKKMLASLTKAPLNKGELA